MAIAHKSAISVGLIYVPVALHKSTRDVSISFNQLVKGTNERVSYKKVSSNTNREVSKDEIVKGFQYEKDKYVVFDNDELERIKTKKDNTMHVEHFAKISEIDSLYYDQNYYVVPQTGAEKAFELLRQAMYSTKKVAIAKTVMGTKQELVVLYPLKDGLIAKTLFYQEELQTRPLANKVSVDKNEVTMAKTLIDTMTKPFQIEVYRDEYQDKLRDAIESKIHGQEIISVSENQPHTAIDLMEALQQSIALTSNNNVNTSSPS